jgi:group I intron endonuclease
MGLKFFPFLFYPSSTSTSSTSSS